MDLQSVLGYRDIPYSGPHTSASATIQTEKVVQNTIKMLLFSKLGDYVRQTTKGGVLIGAIGKSLDQVTSDGIKESIGKALAEYEDIQVINYDIAFKKEIRTWMVHLVFVDNLNKFTSTIDMGLEG